MIIQDPTQSFLKLFQRSSRLFSIHTSSDSRISDAGGGKVGRSRSSCISFCKNSNCMCQGYRDLTSGSETLPPAFLASVFSGSSCLTLRPFPCPYSLEHFPVPYPLFLHRTCRTKTLKRSVSVFRLYKKPSIDVILSHRARNSVGECHLHTVEVVGSNPIVPIDTSLDGFQRKPQAFFMQPTIPPAGRLRKKADSKPATFPQNGIFIIFLSCSRSF